MTRERRKSPPRKTKRLSLTFSDGTGEISGASSNLSVTGLFVRTRKPLNPGTPVRIIIELNEQNKIELMGIVVWARKTGNVGFKDGMGIKLTTVPHAYEDFVEQLG